MRLSHSSFQVAGHSGIRRGSALLRRALLATLFLLCVAGATRVYAAPTITINSIQTEVENGGIVNLLRSTPHSKDGSIPDVDLTYNSMVRITYTVSWPTANALTTLTLYRQINGADSGSDSLTLPIPGNGQSRTVRIAAYWFVRQGTRHTDDIFWGEASGDGARHTRRFRIRGVTNETTNNTADAYSQTFIIGSSGREVLVPLDANRNPDTGKPNRGGLTVSPVDGTHDDDGSSSSTYTFRVMYKHPDGLPPRLHWPYTRDRWRLPNSPDATLPPGVDPGSYNSGIVLCLDTDVSTDSATEIYESNIGDFLGGPSTVSYPGPNPTHALARQWTSETSPHVHWMTPETETNPSPADFRRGVVYRYVVQPTSHEVAVGLPSNSYANVSFLQSLVSKFAQALGFRGVRYVNGDYWSNQNDNTRSASYSPTSFANRRTSRHYTAPFLSLSAGKHGFTYRCTSDLGVQGNDNFGNPIRLTFRFPDYNDVADVAGSRANPPALVFPEVSDPAGTDATFGWRWMQFRKPFVNPALDTDINDLPGSIGAYRIRIPTPVTVPTPLRVGRPNYKGVVEGTNTPIPANDAIVLIDSTRVLSAETVRFTCYYTQSDNLPPSGTAQLLVYRPNDDGSYASPTTYAMVEDPTGAAYNVGRRFTRDLQLPATGNRYPYRYAFRVTDGIRWAEWPGDSQDSTAANRTSLNSLGVNHLANTIRVNNPPVLTPAAVSPAFGATGTRFVYRVNYRDVDNDAPRFAYIYIGTHTDTVVSRVAAPVADPILGGLPLPCSVLTLSGQNTFDNRAYYNGEIAIRGVSGLEARAFRVVDNNATQFTVYDPNNELAGLPAGATIELRRRFNMQPVGGSTQYDAGVDYQFDTATDTTLKLQEGTRTYYFAFTDNWGTLDDPEEGEAVRCYTGTNNNIEGPVVQDNHAPTLTMPEVLPLTGTPATLFTYTVRYTDVEDTKPTQMQVYVNPKVQVAASGLVLARTDTTITVAGTPYTQNQYIGYIIHMKSGAANGKWFTVDRNTANVLHLAPGTDLIASGVAPADTFDIIGITVNNPATDILPMLPSNSDDIVTDGKDYYASTRLPLGDPSIPAPNASKHRFAIRASDGLKVTWAFDFGEGVTPSGGYWSPAVVANRVPTLFSETNIIPSGVTLTVASVAGSVVTLQGGTLTPSAHKGQVVEFTRATAANGVVGNYLISDNTATTLTLANAPSGLVMGDGVRIGAVPVTPLAGPQGTSFTWRVRYTDKDDENPQGPPPSFMQVVIDGVPYNMTPVDINDNVFNDGALYTFTKNDLPSGAHTFYFQANDGANATRLPSTGVFTAPAVNAQPTLNTPFLDRAAGTSEDTYWFKVTYNDPDNDKPDYVRVRITDKNNPANTYTVAMNPTTPAPYDYVQGVVFQTRLGPGFAAKLLGGEYQYTFEAASTGANMTQPANNLGPQNGPAVNNPPTLTLQQNPPAAWPVSPDGNSYVFRAMYQDADAANNPAAQPDRNRPSGAAPYGVMTLTLLRPDGSTVPTTFTMLPERNNGTADYIAGEWFSVQVPKSVLNKTGVYKWTVTATDVVPVPPFATPTAAVSAPMDGPQTVATPMLVAPTAPALPVTPATGIAGRTFTFATNYVFGDATAPDAGSVQLTLLQADGVTPVGNPHPMTTIATDPDLLETTGWLYAANVPIEVNGTYKYRVDALVGGMPVSTGVQDGPIVTLPTLTEAKADPAVGGYAGKEFTFSVKFTGGKADGAPTAVLMKWKKDGVDQPDLALTAPAGDYSAGVVYSVKQVLDQADYTYHFEATYSAPDATPVNPLPTPDQQLSVPAVGTPSLSNNQTVISTDRTKVTYRVQYTQAQNLPATSLQVVIDGGAPVALAPENPADAVSDGAWYAVTVTRPTGMAHTYRFVVGLAGVDPATVIPGAQQADGTPFVGPNEKPVLSNSDGTAQFATVTPAQGNTQEKYTFRVFVKDADAVEPTVFVKLGTLDRLQMVKEDPAADVRQGAYFIYTTTPGQLPVDSHTHTFIAEDAGDTVTLPAGEGYAGPNVLPTTGVTLSPINGTLPLDGVSTIPVDGTLLPALAQKTVNVLYRHPIRGAVAGDYVAGAVTATTLKADGASPRWWPNEWQGKWVEITTGDAKGKRFEIESNTEDTLTVKNTSNLVADGVLVTNTFAIADLFQVTTDAQGRFTHRFVPRHSGAWQVAAVYDGDADNGAGSATASVTVTPVTLTLPAGLSMLSLPVRPDQGVLPTILTNAGGSLVTYNTAAGQYNPVPEANVGPGLGVWLNATNAQTNISVLGTAVDHAKEHRQPIASGWNLVGNPFLLPVHWSELSVVYTEGGNEQQKTLSQARLLNKAADYGWVRENGSYALVHASLPGAKRVLEVGQGAWVLTRTAGQVAFAPRQGRSAMPSEDVTRRSRATSTEWELQLVASNGQVRDAYNYVGVSTSRAADLGGIENPPAIGDYVDLYFPAATGGKRYATDFRSAAAGPQSWEFVVETNTPERPVTLSAPNLSRVPRDLDVFLVDVDGGGKRTYLRTVGGVTFNAGETGKRRFRLEVRSRAEGALTVTGVTLSRGRAGTTVGYTLSRSAAVTVEFYSTSGKLLRTIADRQATPEGRATVAWDGNRSDGTRVPRGIYMMVITAATPEGQTTRTATPMVITK